MVSLTLHYSGFMKLCLLLQCILFPQLIGEENSIPCLAPLSVGIQGTAC